MRDVSKIGIYGAVSFAKARVESPRIRKQHAKKCHAFTVQPDDLAKPLYLVTVSTTGEKIFGDCIETVSGARCQGFASHSHCYHLATVLIHLGLCSKPARSQREPDARSRSQRPHLNTDDPGSVPSGSRRFRLNSANSCRD